jgi:hypothetical protein
VRYVGKPNAVPANVRKQKIILGHKRVCFVCCQNFHLRVACHVAWKHWLLLFQRPQKGTKTLADLQTEGRQWTYSCNVRPRRIRATVFTVENNKYYTFLACVCSLSSPACKAHAPFYIVACLAPPYFYILSHKRRSFREKDIEHTMCVLISSTNFDWNTSHFRKNSAR